MEKSLVQQYPHIIDKLYNLTSITVRNGSLDDIVVSYDFHLKMKSIHIPMNNIKWTESDIIKHGRKQRHEEEHHDYKVIHSYRYDKDILFTTKLQPAQFVECYNLTKITLDTSVKHIPKCCFYRCYSLQEIIFPTTCTSIDVYAFKYCCSLKSLHLPSSIKSIQMGSFNKCYSLTSIQIDNPLITIGHDCFGECTSLKQIIMNNNKLELYPFEITYEQNKQFESLQMKCTNVVVRKEDITKYGINIIYSPSVKRLDDNCFRNNLQLNKLIIPSNITSLGQYCFAECSSLSYISIPSTITTIPYCCFDHCNKLQQIIFESKDITTVTFEQNCFNDCSSLSSTFW